MDDTKSGSQFQSAWQAYREEDYDKAVEAFFGLLDQGQISFELLALTASALFRKGEIAQAQRVFQDVLRLYEQKPDDELEESHIWYWVATAYAVLDDRELATQSLSQALEHNPRLWYKIPHEAEWHKLLDDPEFAAMFQEEKKILDTLLFRGKPMAWEELGDADIQIIHGFMDMMASALWEIDLSLANSLEEGKSVSPQAYALYPANQALRLHLHLHLDENLLYFELEEPLLDEVQAFRLHPKKGFKRILETIQGFQDHINPDNRLQYIKSLISLCKDLYYELPNGTKMRMKKI